MGSSLPPVAELATPPNAPCAIVPLNPNELSRHHDVRAAPRGSAATGIRNGLDDAIDDRCAFSLG